MHKDKKNKLDFPQAVQELFCTNAADSMIRSHHRKLIPQYNCMLGNLSIFAFFM